MYPYPNGPFGNMMPYSNFHDMNLDWVIRIARDFLDQYTHIQDVITQGEADLESKATELEGLLQQWYDTHSQDIADELASAVAALGTAMTARINELNAAADQKAAQTIASIPADYTTLSNSVTNLTGSEEANAFKDAPTLLPDELFVNIDKLMNGAGTALITTSGYQTTDFIPILSGDLCITGSFFPSSSYSSLALYDANKDPIAVIRGETTVYACQYPQARYFRASRDNNDTYYAMTWNNNDIEKYYTAANPTKLPTYYYIYDGYIIDQSGAAAPGHPTWATTDFIQLTRKDTIFTGNFFPNNVYHTLALYNIDKEMIAYATGHEILRVIDYPNAVYFRASYPTDTEEYYLLITNKALEEGMTVHVGAGMDYTTLRAGIEAAVQVANSTVIVHAGEYDLTQEFATEIAAASASAGITLGNNVHVIFMAGSYVKAIFETSSEWISTYFEPFRGYNFTLDGLNIEAKNCRYCVHDERGGADVQYHNVYKNCIMKMECDQSSGATFLSPQCIGGGLGKHGYIEIIGGHYTSLGDTSTGERPCISYHNGSTEGCDSKIFIRDVYLAETTGCFRFGYYGPSTIKTPVLVSGCSMGSPIIERAETSSATVDNFEVIEWNNTIRS